MAGVPPSPWVQARPAESAGARPELSATAEGSESSNPAIDSPTVKSGGRPHSLKDWWPEQVDLSVLHAHSPRSNPLGEDFDYRTALTDLDVEAQIAAMTSVSLGTVKSRIHRGRLALRDRLLDRMDLFRG